METEAPKPCPHCDRDAVLMRDGKSDAPFYVGCSNTMNCPVWPVGRPMPTEAEAIAAWNRDETI